MQGATPRLSDNSAPPASSSTRSEVSDRDNGAPLTTAASLKAGDNGSDDPSLRRRASSDSASRPSAPTGIVIDRQVAEDSIQMKAAVYDGAGDEHFDVISAMIKSVRGSDPDAAVYWIARMLDAGEDPRYIARRLAILASEDVGNADPRGIMIAAAGWELVEPHRSPRSPH